MNTTNVQSYTAFKGHKLLAKGRIDEVALSVKAAVEMDSAATVLVYSDLTGKEMDFDLRGTKKDVLQRLKVFMSTDDVSDHPKPGATNNATKNTTSSSPGRPKLGVAAREVSLLPRHWEWLSTQSGGASATIRRLVDDARKSSSGKELVKQGQERTHKFMSSIAGNLPAYEEALRTLYARDLTKFQLHIQDWPQDIIDYIQILAEPIF
jgi:hypothetical protein